MRRWGNNTSNGMAGRYLATAALLHGVVASCGGSTGALVHPPRRAAPEQRTEAAPVLTVVTSAPMTITIVRAENGGLSQEEIDEQLGEAHERSRKDDPA